MVGSRTPAIIRISVVFTFAVGAYESDPVRWTYAERGIPDDLVGPERLRKIFCYYHRHRFNPDKMPAPLHLELSPRRQAEKRGNGDINGEKRHVRKTSNHFVTVPPA